MEFLHISDLHFRIQYPEAKEGYLAIFPEMTPFMVHLQKGLEKIDRKKLSFILISGDLTENGEEEDYRELKKILDGTFQDIPYVITAGNHDNQEALFRVWCEEDGKKGQDAGLGSVRRIGDTVIVELNNASPDKPDGVISEEHCRWLEQQLIREADPGRVLLMMHHPVVQDPDFDLPMAECADQFAELMRNYQPLAILSGHTHNAFCSRYGQIPYYTAGSLSFKAYGRDDGALCFREYASMNLCSMEGRDLKVTEIPIHPDGKVLGIVRMGGG